MLIMPKLTQIKKVEALTPHDHNNRRSAGGVASNVSRASELSAAAASTQSEAGETNAKDVTVFVRV